MARTSVFDEAWFWFFLVGFIAIIAALVIYEILRGSREAANANIWAFLIGAMGFVLLILGVLVSATSGSFVRNYATPTYERIGDYLEPVKLAPATRRAAETARIGQPVSQPVKSNVASSQIAYTSQI